MISGRAILVLGAVGVGIYLMRKTGQFAAALPVSGLGADPVYVDEDGKTITKADYDQRVAINDKLVAGGKKITDITQKLIVISAAPQMGPIPWQQVVKQ